MCSDRDASQMAHKVHDAGVALDAIVMCALCTPGAYVCREFHTGRQESRRDTECFSPSKRSRAYILQQRREAGDRRAMRYNSTHTHTQHLSTVSFV